MLFFSHEHLRHFRSYFSASWALTSVLLAPLMEEDIIPMQGGGESSVIEPPRVLELTKPKRARHVTELEKLSAKGSMHPTERHHKHRIERPTPAAAAVLSAVASAEPLPR